MAVSRSQPCGAPKSAATEAEPSGSRAFFTLVFAGDLRSIKRNPLQTATPFGRPIVAGLGNAFAEFDEVVAKRDALVDALREIAFLRPGGPTSNKLAMQMERIAIDALDKAGGRS